ncbi:MAG TPA: 50S ribosomal protein L11 methyltransferase, partial [Chthoniobacteraceae bacterium]|nr:50S ribosomal protein L11 methyltransferase [Chthoniobacteraceae bacterium]
WRKLASAKWEDAWMERLAFVRDRLAVTIAGGARMMRLEAFALRRGEAQQLVRAFGGTMVRQRAPLPRRTEALRRAPIAIRGKLLIVSTRVASPERKGTRRRARVIYIPAEMAFGTGDHATTASCLRLIADLSAEFAGEPWELLDLGTGSGILAIAARMLGARFVKACDFDPAAVRIARANVRRNQVDRVTVVRVDVRAWRPERTWDVITANLYSELLIEVLPRIRRAIARNGTFVFSGILRTQEKPVLAALRAAQFKLVQMIRSGKWIAGRARS